MYNNCPLFFNLNVDYQQLQRVIVNYLKDDVQKFIVKDSTNSYNCICLQDVVGRVKDIKFITRDNNVSCTCDVQIFDKDVQQFCSVQSMTQPSGLNFELHINGETESSFGEVDKQLIEVLRGK